MKSFFYLAITAILFVVIGIISWFDVVYGVWDHDSGYYLLVSYLINQGFHPFLDFILQYPPLMIILNSLILRTGLEHQLAVIFIPIAWILANSFLTVLICLHSTKNYYLSWLFGLLYCFFSIENGGNHITLEQGIIFFGLLSYTFYIKRNFISSEMVFLFTFGLLVAAIALVKQVGLVYFIYFAFLLYKGNYFVPIKRGIQNIFILMFGSFSLFFVVFFPLKADYRTIFNQLFNRIISYVEDNSHQTLFITQEFSRSPYNILLFIFVVIITIIVINSKSIKKMEKIEAIILFFIIFITVNARNIRNYPHYTLNAWMPILLLGILGINLFWKKNKNEIIGVNKIQLYSAYGALFFLITGVLFCIYHKNIEKHYRYSELKSFFIPSSEAIRSLTIGKPIILQLGEEPIIEFLSYKRPQRLDIEWAWKYIVFEDRGFPTVIINNFNRNLEVLEKEKKLMEFGYQVVFEGISGDKNQPNRILKLWVKNESRNK